MLRRTADGLLVPATFGLVLRSCKGTVSIDDPKVLPIVERVMPLLDGTRDWRCIVEQFEAPLRPTIAQLLALLEQTGIVESVAGESHEGSVPEGRVRDARILLVGSEPWGEIAASELEASILSRIHRVQKVTDANASPGKPGRTRQAAFATSTASPASSRAHGFLNRAPEWDLAIGAIDPRDLRSHFELSRWSVANGVPVLFGNSRGFEAVIGPLAIPRQSACWNCVRLRLLANAVDPRAEHAVQEFLLLPRPDTCDPLPPDKGSSVVGHLIANEALAFLRGACTSEVARSVLVMNLANHEATRHAVVPMPWCDVCGGAATVAQYWRPPRLPSDGTIEALRQSLAGWVDSRTGIVTDLVPRVPGDENEPRDPVSVHAPLSAYTEGSYTPFKPEGAGGKGLAPFQAGVGAVGEALERYSAARVPWETFERAAARDLGGTALTLAEMILYESHQYANPGFPYRPLEPGQEILWARGSWWHNGETVLVPALLSYYAYPPAGEDVFCQITSNGLAAGADFQDASRRAILELIERDAFMLFWLARLKAQRLSLGPEREPNIARVVEQLEAAGARVELYLLDAGLDIPVVACFGFGDGKHWPAVTVGSAADLSPRKAARRAILELGYSGPMQRRMMRAGEHLAVQSPCDIRSFRDHALFYIPRDRLSTCDFFRQAPEDAIPLTAFAEPSDGSLDAYRGRLLSHGIRIALVDVTSPDVALSPFRVVRAVGANLQPLHSGFRRERLANPRLRALCGGNVNPDPHPMY
jgi:ribosomal protein S12 methylthiotransferase accessory factor